MSRNIFTWIYICICIVSSFETYAQFKSNIVAIGGGGFVTGIISDPKTGDIYCRTDVGGAYRWDAAADSWVQLLDWLPDSQGGLSGVESLAIDPQNPNNIYMLCGISYSSGGMTAILKSTDKGNTFTVADVTSKFKTHANGYGRGNGERLAVDPNNSNVLYCGTRYDGLWKSTDAGYTWTQAWNGVTQTTNNNGICFVLFDPASTSNGVTNTIYIGVSRVWGANVYKSTDGGVTFTDISPDTGYMPHRAALKGTALYLTLADGEGPATKGTGKVYKLNTATGVWTDITPFGNNMSYGGIGIDPANVNRVVVATTGMYTNGMYGGSVWGDFIYFSDDGGANWTLKNGSTSKYDNNGRAWFDGQAHWVECAVFDPLDSRKVRTVGGMGILTSSDIEAATPTWKFDVKGIEETVLIDAICIPGGPLASVFGDVSGFVHTDITAFPTQRHQPSNGNNSGIAYAGKNTNKLVRTTAEGAHIYYSTNQGATWTACATNKGSDGRVALSADGGTILHRPGNSTTSYYSTDNGVSWTASGGSSVDAAIPIGDPVNSNYFYIYNSNGQMLVSSNKGVSFAVAGNPGATSTPWVPTFIRTVPEYEGHIWVPLVDNGLKYSTDHGATYTKVAAVTYCRAVGIGKAISSTSYPAIYIWGTVNGVRGLFRSVDKGATWVKMNDDAHQFGGASIMLGDPNVFGRVYMSSASARGIVYWDDLTKYTVSATKTPAPGGTVSGAGTYAIGSTATLTATPAAGYTFTGWSGDVTGTAASVTVDITSDKAVTANFQAIKYTLTTTVTPATGGTVTGAGSYTSGSTATVTATPVAGYTFTGWSGDATGTAASTTVTMSGNKSVTANFELTKYTLTATASPSAGGTITGAGSYTSGNTATVTATPAAGYTFTGWSGDATGSASSTTVTMNGNKAVTANFQAIKYTLTATASPSAGGTVNGAGSYTSGSTATLTATPAAGYTFKGWSGDATGTTTSTSVTMNSNKSVTATFEVIQPGKYTLVTTASPSAGGTVSGGGSYTSGSTATLTATPASGYTFTGWSGDATGTSTTATVTMNGDKSVTANFAAIKYTLITTASPSAGGTVSGDGSYTSGSTAILTATPAAGYIFTGWSGDATGTASSITVTMDGDKNVTANFQVQANPTKYTLAITTSPSEGGNVSGAGSYDAGDIATLTATPAAGYTFTGWSGDVTGTATSVTVTMDGNKNVQANFSVASVTLSATVVPAASGSVTGTGTYTAGSVVTIEAVAASGYTFTGWSGDIAGTDASQTVTVNGDMVVQANFQGIDEVALKIPKLFSPDNHGDMSTEAWNIENAYLLEGCEIVIYNRQGQKVYSSTGYTTPWDGTSNGKPLPDGAYFYIIRHPDNSKQTGSVTIARLK
jgi:xyloglucan-specific exo-beta-1,4-glucanase